jgi:hypothetical protein
MPQQIVDSEMLRKEFSKKREVMPAHFSQTAAGFLPSASSDPDHFERTRAAMALSIDAPMIGVGTP